MLKAICLATVLCLAPMPVALAQKPPLVTDICPKATWMTGYRIGELMPLHSDQHHPAVIVAETPLRAGYGFEGDIITDLAVGTQVTIVGEVWDMGCNQWMAVAGDQQTNFVYGHALQKLK